MNPISSLAIASVLGLATGDAALRAEPPVSAAAVPVPDLLGDVPSSQAAPAAHSPAVRVRELAHRSMRRQRGAPAASRVEVANRAATREPSRDRYLNSAQIYFWAEGAIYRLYTAPERVSDIVLEPGERLNSVAAGDTLRWVIGDTTSGTGAARRTHILVKPASAGLSTNLVISTDRRVYHVQLESDARTAMASIAWTYPADALIALRRQEPEAPAAEAVAANLAVEALNFDYRIEGDDPPWRPLRAFDDGKQVFIQFPVGLAQGEAPPLFVTGEGGRSELVNYRLRGRYYVVDRLFSAAELRLGERRQQVVRILRTDASGQRRHKGKSS
jgi:P-type conjugative transfer protein TrbG